MSEMSPFRRRLQEAVNARHSRLNPFTEQWVKGALSRDQLGAWAAQHYQYVSQFPRWCATVYGECPDADARDFLLENILEEESGTKHVDLLIRFAEACGTTKERVEDPDNMNAVTRGLQGWCYATAIREHFVVATAALVVGLESQVPSIYRKQLPPLLDSYGFTEDEVEFFDLHITSDEVHGERGYQIVLDHADTPELQERCIRVVRQGADMRFSYTKALYDTYVRPDLGDLKVLESGEVVAEGGAAAGIGSA
jgi:pyrroloquinoline-quinone synthase